MVFWWFLERVTKQTFREKVNGKNKDLNEKVSDMTHIIDVLADEVAKLKAELSAKGLVKKGFY